MRNIFYLLVAVRHGLCFHGAGEGLIGHVQGIVAWPQITEAEAIFQRALGGTASEEDSVRFTAHMLLEMARMSTEDGLVMQLHPCQLQ